MKSGGWCEQFCWSSSHTGWWCVYYTFTKCEHLLTSHSGGFGGNLRNWLWIHQILYCYQNKTSDFLSTCQAADCHIIRKILFQDLTFLWYDWLDCCAGLWQPPSEVLLTSTSANSRAILHQWDLQYIVSTLNQTSQINAS